MKAPKTLQEIWKKNGWTNERIKENCLKNGWEILEEKKIDETIYIENNKKVISRISNVHTFRSSKSNESFLESLENKSQFINKLISDWREEYKAKEESID
jgi:hypothetical protein